MVIYGLKSCDTCRKARKALPFAQFRDVRDEPLSGPDIDRFLAVFGDDLVNRRSTTWRALDGAEREEPPSTLLSRHPALMKRPVIEADGTLVLGWGENQRKTLLKS